MSRSRTSRLRLHAGIAHANASTSANLLGLRTLEHEQKFLEGVVASGEERKLREEAFAFAIASAHRPSSAASAAPVASAARVDPATLVGTVIPIPNATD